MIVVAEKVLVGSGWACVKARGHCLNSAHRWKGGRPWERSVCATESPKTISVLRGTQMAFTIFDYFRVTGAHGTVLDYADLFSVTVQDDNSQDFDTRLEEVLLSMSKIPSDDILESLCKLRNRESAQL